MESGMPIQNPKLKNQTHRQPTRRPKILEITLKTPHSTLRPQHSIWQSKPTDFAQPPARPSDTPKKAKPPVVSLPALSLSKVSNAK
jgi:hypothetical protein